MKKLSELNQGERFLYGGVEWMKLNRNSGTVLALAAEPVFERAFDEANRNDWRGATLRWELNGPFLDRLVENGANRKAFLDLVSSLTADDGRRGYPDATGKITLLSDDMYREYRYYIPKTERRWWTLTPLTCDPAFSCYVRCVDAYGKLGHASANSPSGVRPICSLRPYLRAAVPGEEEAE